MGLAALERFAMMKNLFFVLAIVLAVPTRGADAPAPAAHATSDVCVVVGAVGDPAYADGYAKAAQIWQDDCKQAGAACTVIGLDPPKDNGPTDRDALKNWITTLDPTSAAPVWLVYLGHGTFDGKDARLNLRGPDVTAAELADWLKTLQRRLIFIDGSSCSSPFIPALAGPNRIIITATQSEHEVDYARFGEYFAAAVADPAADIDQEGQTSVLAAFVTASQRVQDFYSENDRMATEHALLNDNGSKQGTPADWFHGTRLIKQPKAGAASGDLARLVALIPSAQERALTDDQLRQRDQLEQDLAKLRTQKAQMAEADYYAALEKIFRQLAAIYVPAASSAAPATP
jgi:hypothetical protein